MKKAILLLLVSTILLGFVFAEPQAPSGSVTGSVSKDAPLEAATLVSLNLGSGGDNMVELYFLTNNAEPNTALEGGNLAPSVSLGFKDDGSGTATNESDLYAYWHIVSGDALDVSLDITQPLTMNETNKIQWQASTTADSTTQGVKAITVSSNTASTGTEETEELQTTNTSDGVFYTHSLKLESEGWAKIDIATTTTDFTSLGAGTYEANLLLVCSTQS